ncbi:MAG: NAD(P)/FAD-dependent oxidoreductase [Propionibacteriales bacterium]|nr:NAD(P)/FAD-dependent oxidoreductase [Propionibacteriales bacterium]
MSRTTQRRVEQSATTRQPQHDVIVVGGGFSGIGIAIKLQQAGYDRFVVLEDGDGVGGTWHWNRYPGVAVDIPSFSYQYSFEQRPTWSRSYAPGAELKAYAEHCVDEYGVRDRFRLNTRVESAVFDEQAGIWLLTTSAGEELTCRFLVNAAGVLTQPKHPDIDGIEDFAGPIVHTARWDDSIDLAGKRVAVIGTGASGVQVIPEIAPIVDSLVVFQRTPIWCLPKPDVALPGPLQWALGRVPGVKASVRGASQAFVELAFPLSAHYHRPLHVANAAERVARGYLRHQVKDQDVRVKLTPSYAVGCKRPSFHNSYLATFNRPNVTLETEPIQSVEGNGIRTVEGTVHEFDVLICATGFKVFEAGNLPSYSVVGRDGVDLDDWWAEHRYQAYEGVSIPGFPNYFTMFGPYGYVGSSYFALVETSIRHILRCLGEADRRSATVVEVTREANDRYFASQLRRRPRQIFFSSSCEGSNSYYFNQHGDTGFRAGTTLEAIWRSATFKVDSYRFEQVPE